MSVFDGDTSSRSEPDPEVSRDAISYEEEEIAIKAGRLQHGDELITFRPIEYDARFSELPGARDELSLSVSHRGVECTELGGAYCGRSWSIGCVEDRARCATNVIFGCRPVGERHPQSVMSAPCCAAEPAFAAGLHAGEVLRCACDQDLVQHDVI